jgi:hypothetical protein
VEEKHQEKLFILHNYVISPLIQKKMREEKGTPDVSYLPEYQEECQIYHRKDDS